MDASKGSSPARLQWLDVAKGVGIALVVFGHVARGLNVAGLYAGPWFLWVDRWIYSFHMPLFFFLSGYLLDKALARESSCALVKQKAVTLLYPYLLWSLLQGGLEVSLSQYTNGHLTWGDLSGVLWQPRAQFWFLYVLFLLYVMSALLAGVWKKSALSVLVFALFLYSTAPLYQSRFPLKAMAIFSLYFFAGACWGKRSAGLITSDLKWLGVLGFAVLSVAYATNVDTIAAQWWARGARLLVAFLGICSVVVISQWLPVGQTWLARLGRHSMMIFLAHVMVAAGVRIVLVKCLGVTHVGVHLALATMAGLVLPLLLAEWMERKQWGFLTTLPNGLWPRAKKAFLRC